MAVLGRSSGGHAALEAQPAEPAIGQVEVNLFTQPPLGTDAVAVTTSSIRIINSGSIRGSTHVAVVRLKVSPNARQIDEPIDLAQQVIARDVSFQAEAIIDRISCR